MQPWVGDCKIRWFIAGRTQTPPHKFSCQANTILLPISLHKSLKQSQVWRLESWLFNGKESFDNSQRDAWMQADFAQFYVEVWYRDSLEARFSCQSSCHTVLEPCKCTCVVAIPKCIIRRQKLPLQTSFSSSSWARNIVALCTKLQIWNYNRIIVFLASFV